MSRHHRAAKIGGRAWQARRREVLDAFGWRCADCRRAGALEVDHHVPLADGGEPWDLSNLRPLCRACHAAKTRRERNGTTDPAAAAWDQLVLGLSSEPARSGTAAPL